MWVCFAGLCVFFQAQPFQGRSLSPEVLLGFNSKGMHVFTCQPQGHTESIPLSRILHYGLYENSVMLEVRRGTGITAIHYCTQQGQRICTVLQHYFNEALAHVKVTPSSRYSACLLLQPLSWLMCFVSVSILVVPFGKFQRRCLDGLNDCHCITSSLISCLYGHSTFFPLSNVW